MTEPTGRLLVYAPVSLFDHDGRRFVEDQAVVGLRRWAQHFAQAHVMMPVAHTPPPAGWTDLRDAALPCNLTLHALPAAWRPGQFARVYRPTRARIAQLIRNCDYPSFAIGGLFGDWGAVAAFEAHAQRRRFAAWTDRVESEVTRRGATHGPRRARLRQRLYWRPMAALERAVIRRATVGLFHGRETYDAYAPHARAAELVHDIMIDKTDRIGADELAAKQAEARTDPLRIVYAGRADAMKGPMDWIATLEALKARGVAFRATWLGDGPERAAMRTALAHAGLSDAVALPGFVTDRAAVMTALRAAHVFLFCHRTPESPRCLIEALVSGTPLIGHDGAFARDLVARDARAGWFFPMGDAQAMAAALAALDADVRRWAPPWPPRAPAAKGSIPRRSSPTAPPCCGATWASPLRRAPGATHLPAPAGRHSAEMTGTAPLWCRMSPAARVLRRMRFSAEAPSPEIDLSR